jgi:hypothetical protein
MLPPYEKGAEPLEQYLKLVNNYQSRVHITHPDLAEFRDREFEGHI